MRLNENTLRKIIRKEVKDVLSEQYIELFMMHDNFERGIDNVVDAYLEWQEGPAWEGDGPSRRQELDAIKQILRYLEEKLKSHIGR